MEAAEAAEILLCLLLLLRLPPASARAGPPPPSGRRRLPAAPARRSRPAPSERGRPRGSIPERRYPVRNVALTHSIPRHRRADLIHPRSPLPHWLGVTSGWAGLPLHPFITPQPEDAAMQWREGLRWGRGRGVRSAGAWGIPALSWGTPFLPPPHRAGCPTTPEPGTGCPGLAWRGGLQPLAGGSCPPALRPQGQGGSGRVALPFQAGWLLRAPALCRPPHPQRGPGPAAARGAARSAPAPASSSTV